MASVTEDLTYYEIRRILEDDRTAVRAVYGKPVVLHCMDDDEITFILRGDTSRGYSVIPGEKMVVTVYMEVEP